ncbi:hypothetical protein RUM43_001800 [Polyplax serrata]|uniref:Uncharacterized protein n=1 Tax=Polyplax serrata TaxID=468196 RepID=A0AAN8SEE6_POLSC
MGLTTFPRSFPPHPGIKTLWIYLHSVLRSNDRLCWVPPESGYPHLIRDRKRGVYPCEWYLSMPRGRKSGRPSEIHGYLENLNNCIITVVLFSTTLLIATCCGGGKQPEIFNDKIKYPIARDLLIFVQA